MAAEHRWEPAYCAFVAARHEGYARAAAAVLGDSATHGSVDDVMSEVFTRLYVAWPRLEPGEADDVARRLLVSRVAAARGPLGRRAVADRLGTALEDDAPPPVATHDLPSDPEVERLLLAGRRARRQRRRTALSVGVGMLAALVLAAVLLPGALSDAGTHHDRRHDVLRRPRIVDFVLGTTIDQQMQRRIRAHFPDSGEATLVYMGDLTRRAALLPDWLFAEAYFWQADYALDSGEQLSVQMSYPAVGHPPGACAPAQPGAPPCRRTPLGPGTAVTYGERIFSTGVFWFTTRYVAPDGFAVSVRDGVIADNWGEAGRLRSLDRAETYALVTDAKMTFPPPRKVAG